MSKIKASEVNVRSSEDVEFMCIERLQREAFKCLDTFPVKVGNLNKIIDEYTPESVRNRTCTRSMARRAAKSQITLSTVKNCDLTIAPQFDVSSYYSMTTHDRSRLRHGICKRRYYRMRTINGPTLRRRPSPLGQLLAFIASRLAVCTRKIIIAPSYYIIDRIISMFIQRRQVKNAQCGTSTSLTNAFSCYMITLKEDNSIVGNFIRTMKPAAVQLIADTTILKRWLQALALTTNGLLSSELTNATHSAETIDGWAYELFFHLKYLQVNRARRATDEATISASKVRDEAIHVNLWHRLVQLRDNYIILYEVLNNDLKTDDLVLEFKQLK